VLYIERWRYLSGMKRSTPGPAASWVPAEAKRSR
jgi:hypothetical protein